MKKLNEQEVNKAQGGKREKPIKLKVLGPLDGICGQSKTLKCANYGTMACATCNASEITSTGPNEKESKAYKICDNGKVFISNGSTGYRANARPNNFVEAK